MSGYWLINPKTHNLGVKRWGLEQKNCHHPRVKKQGVVIVIHDELKSQPCLTIHYTHNETLKGLRCCELPESVQTHSTLVSKVENR